MGLEALGAFNPWGMQVTLLTTGRKSQIAIEYCYLWKERYPESHVFWVHSGTLDGFQQAYRDIAREMSIPGASDPQADTLTIVRDWLSKPENGLWLLVLDNADDLDLWFKSSPSIAEPNLPPIGSFLPRSDNGFMITTTRDKRIGQRLTDRESEINVTPMTSGDAEQLLCCKMSKLQEENNEETATLVDILGNIPLAITQAAAFMLENSMAVTAYLQELETSDSDLQDYLDENLPDPRRYPNSENSVTRTWKISFDQIAKHHPLAADLLSIMVQLDRRAIPTLLIRNTIDRSVTFNKAVGVLQAYLLIKIERGGSSPEIHRLIQLSTQRWLGLQQAQSLWQEKALDLMVKNFPDGEYGTWGECEKLLLHAKCVIKPVYLDISVDLQRAVLLEKIANYRWHQGRFKVGL